MKNIAKKITSILLKLNNLLYNWPSHLIILALWVYSLSTMGVGSKWFISGICMWAALIAFRVVKDKGLPPAPKDKKEWLGYLVGLNLCVVLSVVSIPVIALLAYVEKQEPEQ